MMEAKTYPGWTLLLGVALFACIAGIAEWGTAAGGAVGSVAPLAAGDRDWSQFQGNIDAGDYLRNPDKTPREVFSNVGSSIGLTLVGVKNIDEATTRYPEAGPVQIRAGVDPRSSKVIGIIPRGQPYFAVRVQVPAGNLQAPVQVYLWNDDRNEEARLSWTLKVD